jgi:4-amino-4-deoxy-L-arabinose transferase-like glycosyltransferase
MQQQPIKLNYPRLSWIEAWICFCVALIPRTAGLADFLTTDEVYHWIERTIRFSHATTDYRWDQTILTGHPGVTTMWLGSLGLLLEQYSSVLPAGVPALLVQLAWLRLPGAILHALVVALGYLLLVRCVGQRTALIAGLLWATAPYLIAHGRLLHLDANLTDFVTLSVLLLIAYQQRLSWMLLVGSGACAGLALLTKGPALILLPFVGLVLFALPDDGRQITASGRRDSAASGGLVATTLGRLRLAIVAYIPWLVCALLVVFALWPALWVVPGAAFARYVGEITDNGGRPNGDGQFFLGSANADPGLLFYPIADLFRTTPAMLLGLVLAAWFAIGRLRHTLAALWATPRARALLTLLAFVVFWTVIMSLGPKKFDRYVLPTWPALIILAAAGWDALLERIPRTWIQRAILSLGLVTEVMLLGWFHPYYLSYYNPLLGGGQVAQRMFLIGWGEGMDQVGAFLRSRPDLEYGPVLSALGPTLQPFIPVDVRDVSDYGKLPANYAIVYLESLQRAADPALYTQLQTTVPLHVVSIHGIDYATIYQLPRPFVNPSDAQFGDALRIRGFTIDRALNRITLTPAWDVRAQPSGDYRVFVHLLAADGKRVAQIDLAPGGDSAPQTTAWQPGQQFAVPLPLDLPSNLPSGTYQLVIGVYDSTTNTRLALHGGQAANPVQAGGDALLVEQIIVNNE